MSLIRTITSIAKTGVAAGALTAVVATTAHAGGFALREQSAYGQGMSFAGVAAGGALSTMFWNPATLGQTNAHIESEQIFSFIVPTSDINVTTPALGPLADQGDIGLDAFVPAGYNAYRFNDRLVFGMSVNGPFGLSTKYPLTSPIRANGISGTSEVFSINATPTVAYDVTDRITIGFGIQVQYFDVRLTGANTGAAALGIITAEGDDIGVGITAGVTFRPVDGTEIGIGFRSAVQHELDGSIVGTGPAAAVPYKVKGKFETPETITVGIRQRVTDSFLIAAGVEWTNFSRIDSINLVDQAGLGRNVRLPFDYHDAWYFSLGGEYQFNDQLQLRAGAGWELSPISNDNRSFRLPDDDRLWLSAGMTYDATDMISVDLGYSFITTFDTTLDPAPAGGPVPNNVFGADADANVHIFALGVNVKLGGHHDEIVRDGVYKN